MSKNNAIFMGFYANLKLDFDSLLYSVRKLKVNAMFHLYSCSAQRKFGKVLI
jgi:hypothetical protein